MVKQTAFKFLLGSSLLGGNSILQNGRGTTQAACRYRQPRWPVSHSKA